MIFLLIFWDSAYLLGEGTANTWWFLLHNDRKSRHRRIKKQRRYERLTKPQDSCPHEKQGWAGGKWEVWIWCDCMMKFWVFWKLSHKTGIKDFLDLRKLNFCKIWCHLLNRWRHELIMYSKYNHGKTIPSNNSYWKLWILVELFNDKLRKIMCVSYKTDIINDMTTF